MLTQYMFKLYKSRQRKVNLEMNHSSHLAVFKDSSSFNNINRYRRWHEEQGMRIIMVFIDM